jgi:hypothetical protein
MEVQEFGELLPAQKKIILGVLMAQTYRVF